MKITKQLMKRFENPDITVRIINGTYKRAVASVTYANGFEYRIEVERSHPIMSHFNSIGKPVFIYPESRNSGFVKDVPKEFQHVVDKLYDLAYVSDKEAVEMYKNIMDSIEDFNEQMGF